MLNVSKGPIIKTIDISIKNLPVDNLSITQLSDLHLYPSTSKKTFDNIVNLTNFTNPDILVITGDVFDFDDIDFITKNFDFSKFKAKYGIFAITGNHEYYIKTENFFKIMKHFNIQVLDNRFQNVENIVNLIGIDDTENKKINQQKILTEINLQLDSNKNYSKLPKILLIHRPDIFDFASESGIDLQLSGHTHAGQIPPADIIEFIFFKYMVGLYSKNNKFNSKLYISPGTRFWGPPMRLFSKSEITKINLKKN
jgi:predicted MPP superfamily phosphohydrolase